MKMVFGFLLMLLGLGSLGGCSSFQVQAIAEEPYLVEWQGNVQELYEVQIVRDNFIASSGTIAFLVEEKPSALGSAGILRRLEHVPDRLMIGGSTPHQFPYFPSHRQLKEEIEELILGEKDDNKSDWEEWRRLQANEVWIVQMSPLVIAVGKRAEPPAEYFFSPVWPGWTLKKGKSIRPKATANFVTRADLGERVFAVLMRDPPEYVRDKPFKVLRREFPEGLTLDEVLKKKWQGG